MGHDLKTERDGASPGQKLFQQKKTYDPDKLAWERAGDHTKIFDEKFLVEVKRPLLTH